MTVLVLGAGGQVGRAVVAACPEGHRAVACRRADVDITDEISLGSAVSRIRPDWIVNAAAYTAVDFAEDEPEKAAAINDEAVRKIAAAAQRANSRLLHLSTDFVFDGNSSTAYRPDSPTGPLNVYGATKLAGERHVIAIRGVVLRTSWVYADSGKNFVLTMLKLMRERDSVRVVCDQVGAPTWAATLSQAIWAIILADIGGGIYHWCDDGVASWYDFAVAVQEEALVRDLLEKPVPVIPIRTVQFPTKARRPSFSVLDADSTRERLRLPHRHWRDNLRAMLDELRTP